MSCESNKIRVSYKHTWISYGISLIGHIVTFFLGYKRLPYFASEIPEFFRDGFFGPRWVEGAILHSALIYYWVGRKKSEFFKNGFKPLLPTSWGTHNSNFIFGSFFGPILDRFWAQKTKNRPKKEFHFFDFLLLFVSIVIKSFNTVN